MKRDRSLRRAQFVSLSRGYPPLPDEYRDWTPAVLHQLAVERRFERCLLDEKAAQLAILRSQREDLAYSMAQHAAFHHQHDSTSSVIAAVLSRGADYHVALLENHRTDWGAFGLAAPHVVATIVDPWRLSSMIDARQQDRTFDERLRIARAALAHSIWEYPSLRRGPLAISCHVGHSVVRLIREVIGDEGREALPRLARTLLPNLHVSPLFIDSDAMECIGTHATDNVAELFVRFIEDAFRDCRLDLRVPTHPYDVESSRATIFGVVLVAGALRGFFDGDALHARWIDRLLGSPSAVVRAAVYSLAYDLLGARPLAAEVDDFDRVLIGAGPAGVFGMAANAAFWAAANSGRRVPALPRVPSLRWICELAEIPWDSDAVVARVAFVREDHSLALASDWLNPTAASTTTHHATTVERRFH